MSDEGRTDNQKPKPQPRGRAKPSSQPERSKRQQPVEVASRPQRYMVAALPQMQLMTMGVTTPPLSPAALLRMLEDDPRVDVRRRLVPSRATLFGTTGTSVPEIVVADMDFEHARTLRQSLPQVRIEQDRPLAYARVTPLPERPVATGFVQPLGNLCTFDFLVRDADGDPFPGVTITITGTLRYAQGITGRDGRASVTLIGEVPEMVQSVLFDPPAGHWNLKLDRPLLELGRDNVIKLRELSETFPDFPRQQIFGWGQRAMSLDRVAPTFRGKGVKIAIIDSGADIKHPDLAGQVTDGIDLVEDTAAGWAVDTVRHGSHCAGVITGADNGLGILGFATEAEVHACKIFPGGWFSDLIDALDYCIDKQIDVVNLSLGTLEGNSFVEDKINEARQTGVACIVAAGNTGGPVNFPGTLPTVLTVAAIGRLDTYHAESSHGSEAMEPLTDDGFFAAKFSCHGPEIDVCAPGVAILSSVTDRGYAVWDGTSMAAPHVSGLAALVLAHREEFRGEFRSRDARRVDRLFEILKSSCTELDLGDPHRTGAGMPDALRALGTVSTGMAPTPSADIRQILEQLLAVLGSPSATSPQSVAPMALTPSETPAAPQHAVVDEIGVRNELMRLDQEMYAAGLTGYAPDPLA
ncbi:S8 family serine peptidase [Nonomuraea sp. NN258]|uniref:S8 family serine peptidase n=1 Tax=Nonomuraea antri TaxID=2730852 RepID=UPI00156A5395|nr:S8 family serine peptidase [Nonomuraea antri]NRQ37414.1 S8 family serine peptidase [Nonomuraea antri]